MVNNRITILRVFKRLGFSSFAFNRVGSLSRYRISYATFSFSKMGSLGATKKYLHDSIKTGVLYIPCGPPPFEQK